MTEEQAKTRNASELLLELEQKVNTLMQLHRSLDLNIKVMSNKLNQMIELLTIPDNVPQDLTQPLYNMPNGQLYSAQSQLHGVKETEPVVPKDMPITIETMPVGFARTSRSDNQPATPAKNVPTPSLPLPQTFPAKEIIQPTNEMGTNKKPVSQRVVDKNGKSLLMCSVEVVDAQTNATVHKSRTSGTGKWQASLPFPQSYKVIVSKQDSISKQNINTTQTITIDQYTNTELPTLICK